MANSKNKKTPPSITAKLEDNRLKRTIARRKRARQVTHLFDHAVPSSLLFRGVFPGQNRRSLDINVSEQHQLSPYVIHLKEPLPNPEEILVMEEMKPIRLNLLVPESHLRRIEDIRPDRSTTDDLRLNSSDLQGQLNEDWSPSLPRLRWTLPSFSFPSLKRSKNGTWISQPAFDPISLDTLNPPEAPEDLLHYFDLPEFDEQAGEETTTSELLLDSIEDALEDSQEHEKAPKAARFHWPKRSFPKFSMPTFFEFAPGWHRALGAFILLSFMFTLPIHAMNVVNNLRDAKHNIETSGQQALGDLEAGANAVLIRDGASAANSFSRAATQFSNALEDIEHLGAGTSFLLSTLPVTQSSYKSGSHLIEAGEAISKAGQRLSEGFIALSNELNPTPTSRMKLLSTYANSALPHLRAAMEHLEKVKPSTLPEDQRDMLVDIQNQLPILIGSIEQFVEFSDMLRIILGDEGTKRYLLLFQNNTELRPTGGFLGSFAELSITDGVITNMSIPGGGTYDLQGNLSTYTIAPKPLQLLKARWEFQDANWFADFPTSARQALQFYYDAGGPTMDGVVAVNATYVADLLDLLGPIEMPEYNRTINAENFVFETQKIVELEYDKQENRPKEFIGDLAPKMLDRIMEKSEQDFLSIVDRINKGLSERDIQLYFTNEDLQRQITTLGWAGEVKWTDGDYLMVIDTNLGGGKTDGVIEQNVDVVVNIDEQGQITNTVTVTRTHHGIRGSTFSGVNNVDYLRLYVPKGSELLNADGFSIPDESLFEYPLDGWTVDDDLLYIADTEKVDPASGTNISVESGKTVFGNWVQTKPGTQSVATFTYRLPFTIETLEDADNFLNRVKGFVGIPSTEEYRLTIQKQSGVLDRSTHVTVHYPDSLVPLWSTHDLNNAYVTNATDAFFAVLFEHQED